MSLKFEAFQKVCEEVKSNSSHLQKTKIIRDFAAGLTSSNKALFFRLLMIHTDKRIYYLDNKQLVKLFATVFRADQQKMTDHFNSSGDVSQTIEEYAKESKEIRAKGGQITCDEVEKSLTLLATKTKEHEHVEFLNNLLPKMSAAEVRVFVRLIRKDLRVDAGSKIILDAISPTAYAAYQTNNDLKSILSGEDQEKIKLNSPIKPMVAEAHSSFEQVFKKCNSGLYAEVKYDGERLQLHKAGDNFTYFSRSLKQVPAHKTEHLREYVKKAIPLAESIILDGEILLYDTVKNCPLPFGTLGVHKKKNFKEATVCFMIFDCVYFNGTCLLNKPLQERRKIMQENIQTIPGRIMLTDQKLVTNVAELEDLFMESVRDNLEGLVLKDPEGAYEPGKRHWIKMKKDYINGGGLADSADLVVLGAYYGTGLFGGVKSIYLMGCMNPKTKKWYTVTKVGNGFDNETIQRLNTTLVMDIVEDKDSVPDWLVVNKSLVPDFIVRNVHDSPVWEITGAEFSKSDKHTADGISIRFPRVTRPRPDKTWKEATNLDELKSLANNNSSSQLSGQSKRPKLDHV